MPQIIFAVFAMFAFASAGWARPKHVPVNMPVSLAVGTTVRTPEFLVKHSDYKIEIRVKRGVPFGQLSCMIGGDRHPSHCDMYHWDEILEAEWKVLDGEHIVAQGSATGSNGGMSWSDDFMDRYLGEFVGEANKKYVVEVTFTKDGTPLNGFEPRLIVEMPDF